MYAKVDIFLQIRKLKLDVLVEAGDDFACLFFGEMVFVGGDGVFLHG